MPQLAVKQVPGFHLRGVATPGIPEEIVENSGGGGAGDFDDADSAFADRSEKARQGMVFRACLFRMGWQGQSSFRK